MKIDELRDAVAILLRNSEENGFDDNPNHHFCGECGWDSRTEQPLANEPHWMHKPGCELWAARRLLEAFVEETDALDDGAPAPPAEPVEGGDDAPSIDEAVHKMLSVMSLYAGYEVKTRGPMGLLLDAIQDLRPEVREFLDASCDHGKCNTISDAAGDATRCFFPEADDDQWPLAVDVLFERVPFLLHPLGAPRPPIREGMRVVMKGGVSLGVPLSRYPKLEAASPDARRNFHIKAGGAVIHWPELDETIFVASLFMYPWAKNQEGAEVE